MIFVEVKDKLMIMATITNFMIECVTNINKANTQT